MYVAVYFWITSWYGNLTGVHLVSSVGKVAQRSTLIEPKNCRCRFFGNACFPLQAHRVKAVQPTLVLLRLPAV